MERVSAYPSVADPHTAPHRLACLHRCRRGNTRTRFHTPFVCRNCAAPQGKQAPGGTESMRTGGNSDSCRPSRSGGAGPGGVARPATMSAATLHRGVDSKVLRYWPPVCAVTAATHHRVEHINAHHGTGAVTTAGHLIVSKIVDRVQLGGICWNSCPTVSRSQASRDGARGKHAHRRNSWM